MTYNQWITEVSACSSAADLKRLKELADIRIHQLEHQENVDYVNSRGDAIAGPARERLLAKPPEMPSPTPEPESDDVSVAAEKPDEFETPVGKVTNDTKPLSVADFNAAHPVTESVTDKPVDNAGGDATVKI